MAHTRYLPGSGGQSVCHPAGRWGHASAVLCASLLLTGLVTVPHSAFAQARTDNLPLFADETPLQLRIEAPFRELSRAAPDRPELDAVIAMNNDTGAPVSLPIKMRIRGKSRLTICDFPPLRVDFPKDGGAGTAFAGQNHLKLVTLCQRSSTYRDYLALEFTIYKIFNALTDRSFRVRPADIEFVYTDSKRDQSFTERGFFIEEDWEVARREGLDVIELEKIPEALLDPAYTTLDAMFQYFIGNTDWAVLDGPGEERCCHNGAVIGKEGGPYYVVPYDFDQAGLINAEYASPSEVVRIRSVRERRYWGLCSMNPELDRVVEKFEASRASLERVIDESPASERSRRSALGYIDDFYATLEDPKRFEKQIVERCR